MLSGSAILRVGVLLVVAALLATLVQLLRPRDDAPVETPIAKPVPETGRAGSQVALPPVVTRPSGPAAPGPDMAAAPAPSPAPPPVAPAPIPAPPPEPAPRPVPEPVREPVRPSAPVTGSEAIDNAAETAGPRGIALVDLNTGSVAELNGLKGGGMIGRAIVGKRPYASVGDLLSKRVLSRATYERIKDQVTVR